MRSVDDPLVSKTLQNAKKAGAPFTSAEIRGYLVDWVILKSKDSRSIIEFVVMKNGTIYAILGMSRPSAALGSIAPARLQQEPAREAKARINALEAAQLTVNKLYPEFASVKPAIYGYLVRIHRADGTYVDVWVDPDVDPGRFFYNIELRKINKKKR